MLDILQQQLSIAEQPFKHVCTAARHQTVLQRLLSLRKEQHVVDAAPCSTRGCHCGLRHTTQDALDFVVTAAGL
jgi:hypothetical protein